MAIDWNLEALVSRLIFSGEDMAASYCSQFYETTCIRKNLGRFPLYFFCNFLFLLNRMIVQ